MGTFVPLARDIKEALRKIMKNDGVYLGDTFSIKYYDEYTQIKIDSKNSKGYVIYDIYFNDDGKIVYWKQHK